MTSVGIFIYDDCDLLDVGGPYEVFLTADRLARRAKKVGVFDVKTVSHDGGPVTSYGGMGLTPHSSVADNHDFDVIVIPGAVDIESVLSAPEITGAVATLCQTASVVSSVCTGAFLLGDIGLLQDIDWTTHHEDVDALSKRIDSSRGKTLVRWADTGRVVTSGGLSSGIAMALHLVHRIHNKDLATATARQLEYEWNPNNELT